MRIVRIELTQHVWKTSNLPLIYIRYIFIRKRGLEPRPSIPKTDVLPYYTIFCKNINIFLIGLEPIPYKLGIDFKSIVSTIPPKK